MDQATRLGRVVIFVASLHFTDEGVEFAQDPTIDLGTFAHRHLGCIGIEAVDVGIHREERIRLNEFAEECAARFEHTFCVELQIVPRRRVGNHVPAHGIGAVFLDCAEGIDGIAQTLRHFLTVFVQNETIRNHRLESYAVKHHRCDGMERKEPTARLVYALGDEVGGINRAVVEQFLVLKRIVDLGIRHGTRVKPNVDKVGFAVHRRAGGRNQNDVVDIRTVEVDEVVVFATVIAGNETFVFERIGRHHTGGDSLLDFVIKFLD